MGFVLGVLVWMLLCFGFCTIYWSAAFPFLHCRRRLRYGNPARIVYHRYRPGLIPIETYYYTCCGQEFGGTVPHCCAYDFYFNEYEHVDPCGGVIHAYPPPPPPPRTPDPVVEERSTTPSKVTPDAS